jgi:acetylornithine deacetylase/succinyl-diaminopimelate desuccinylase-like protein
MAPDANMQEVLARLEQARDAMVKEITRVCEIPAPTFNERARGAHVAGRLRQIGLREVAVDDVGNVTAIRPGTGDRRLMVVAHLDTVFDEHTDVTVQRYAESIRAPGVGDNSASLGVLLQVLEHLHALPLPAELVVAASVGEEGVGDLRGARALISRWGRRLDGVIAVDGRLSGIVTEGVGSYRYRLRVRAPGGHSWGDFGRPSAVHELARLVARLADLDVPRAPRTTFNVGTFHGGTSVNTIAAEAMAEVDLRSLQQDTLDSLDARFHTLVEDVALPAGAQLDVERIGQRPVGHAPRGHWLIRAAERALDTLGIHAVKIASSTDANIAMAAGIPAICFGVYRGSGAHTLKERVEIDSLVPGAQALALLLSEASRGA